jgi:hypothetical protein
VSRCYAEEAIIWLYTSMQKPRQPDAR